MAQMKAEYALARGKLPAGLLPDAMLARGDGILTCAKF